MKTLVASVLAVLALSSPVARAAGFPIPEIRVRAVSADRVAVEGLHVRFRVEATRRFSIWRETARLDPITSAHRLTDANGQAVIERQTVKYSAFKLRRPRFVAEIFSLVQDYASPTGEPRVCVLDVARPCRLELSSRRDLESADRDGWACELAETALEVELKAASALALCTLGLASDTVHSYDRKSWDESFSSKN